MMQQGQQIRDYVLEDKIGEGGMGEVWRARHRMLDKVFAIKVMAERLAADPQFGDRFVLEAKAQAKLQHPNILGATDFFVEGGGYFLVMPFLEGGSLDQRLQTGPKPMPIPAGVAIAKQALAGLDAAHRMGVVHRDIKPSNILFDRDGRAYLSDFGIALMVGQERMTRTGTSVGTPHYISPEQIRSPRQVDHRTDIYSFGCVLYEMLAGRPPFDPGDAEGDTEFAIKDGHLNRQPLPVRHWNAAVPEVLDAVVMKALSKNPAERQASCADLIRALDAASGAGRTTPAPAKTVVASPPVGGTVAMPSAMPPYQTGPGYATGPTQQKSSRMKPVLAMIVIATIAVAAVWLWMELSGKKESAALDPARPVTGPAPVAAGTGGQQSPVPTTTEAQPIGGGSGSVAAAAPPEPPGPPEDCTEKIRKGLNMGTYNFETITVDEKGKIVKRETKQAEYFVEDLGAGIRLDMTWIGGGKFMMGTSQFEYEAALSKLRSLGMLEGRLFDIVKDMPRIESPQHQVSVRSFFCGKVEVTQDQWQQVAKLPKHLKELDIAPSRFKGEKRPVERISWADAVEFCDRLRLRTGRTYRLPSEAEWEYACRGGTVSTFSFGPTITPDYVNFNGTLPLPDAPVAGTRQETTPVAAMGFANPAGLFDMHGNVYEWCQDFWFDTYDGAPQDGSARAVGQGHRVMRGGSWWAYSAGCRSASREPYWAEGDSLGFRVVMEVPEDLVEAAQ